MTQAQKPIIVFDLDGTLAETAPDIIGTLNLILQREGLAPVPVAKARDLVGAGAKALIQRGFQLQGRPLDDGTLEVLFERFLHLYAGRVADESHLYPGVEAALAELTADGFVLAVCTNKPEHHSRLLLEALGITDYFSAICGRDTFAFSKPDPRHLTATIEQAGGDPAQAVMVGDSKTDVDTAKAAGIPVIVVPFGYTSIPPAELGGDRLVRSFEALRPAVQALLPGAFSREVEVGSR